MTTFKNNARYAELLFSYLDAAWREDSPLGVETVLKSFIWRFKGGSLRSATDSTRLRPEVSDAYFPDGTTDQILEKGQMSQDMRALCRILEYRRQSGRLRSRGLLARLGSYQLLVSKHGEDIGDVRVYSGMKAVYRMFEEAWGWAKGYKPDNVLGEMEEYVREMTLASAQVSRMYLPKVEGLRTEMWSLLKTSRFAGLVRAILDVKHLIYLMGGAQARKYARMTGIRERELWEDLVGLEGLKEKGLSDPWEDLMYVKCSVGPLRLRVSQEVAVWGMGSVRYALGKSDAERFHQLLMSAASAIYGVTAQSVVGTPRRKAKASLAITVAERNIQRIVTSSRLVPLGDEVLVCKGYRRVYTAHLAVLAGKLCTEELGILVREAKETAGDGVLDVDGMLWDLRELDAEGSLNAAKMFKICPAPDVSPGYAMMDRIKQIGNGNVVDKGMMPLFEEELRSQILRAYIRGYKGRLELRNKLNPPLWYPQYLTGKFDEVPSIEIHTYLKWEGTAAMPEVCNTDPSNWKDSGLGADTIWESQNRPDLKCKSNMMTRLVFDDECPMPGTKDLNPEHVIKFFVKAEGHKDPARGIFSSNLMDRQAQSWMEKAVEEVAREHPSFMIGASVDSKEAKVAQLVEMPRDYRTVALYYSFDISGWSAKMPAEPQRISHRIWSQLYGGHLFSRAHEINEGAHIYLNIDGYVGWFKNTHANLEGFNGKEMTMVLVALLSLSVREWRKRVVELKYMTEQESENVAALLFAYIDDGLCRIDLPRNRALACFEVYKTTVNETFGKCGFSVEVSKCFPSDKFAIFLNEVYLGGRHVVHGVRAAMAIGAEPTERHTSLTERVTTVSTGCRGAVMAGLNPLSATFLMAYHAYLHLQEWVKERDPVVLAGWSFAPRAWGGLGMPNTMQLAVSGSGSAFEEGISTMQAHAKLCPGIKNAFGWLCRSELSARTAVGVLTAPLSGQISEGYMVDSRVPSAVRSGLIAALDEGKLSSFATRLLKYADTGEFSDYAEAIVPLGNREVMNEQMFDNLAEAHPHDIFSAFARRLEKSMTILSLIGRQKFQEIIVSNREEACESVRVFRKKVLQKWVAG